MAGNMQYLIYVSQAVHPMSDEELAEILRKSRVYNKDSGITGLLIYKLAPDGKRGNFMQLLEGDAGKLDEVFERIAADKRHHTKIILERKDIAQRNFPDWTMGFQNVKIEDFEDFDGYSDLGSEDFWAVYNAGETDSPLEVMKSFYSEGDD